MNDTITLSFPLTANMIAEGSMAAGRVLVQGQVSTKSKRWAFAKRGLGMCVLFLAVFALSSGWLGHGFSEWGIGPLLGFALGWVVAAYWVAHSTTRMCNAMAKTVSKNGPWQVEVSLTHLEERGSMTRHRSHLSQVRDVVRIRDATVVVLGSTGVAVPDTALPSDMSAEAFEALIRQRVADAKAAT